ncbi:multiheme c-type cytochrome [Armatimonas rosea]|uniref:Tetrahaem cytochrome domain-containing protein n=1 Tax=Armatimonas rosea TaxID=685828 RepID=A0A7W9SQJ3_ARMRO|nr:multiheme c-type cytochrome [Armatimonas rosea]MBB6050188.1 hypothetical protein [Armatimonas rosea]
MRYRAALQRALVVGLPVLLAVMAGCLGDPSLTPSSPKPTPAAVTFVGNAACAECHPDIAKSHSQSNHAHTLSLLTHDEAGVRLPPLGKIGSSEFVLQKVAETLTVAIPGLSQETVPLELALGSGKTGVTYVAFLDESKMAEFRMSYFPAKSTWYITPGQEKLAPGSLGKIHSAANAKKCLLCHAVSVPDPVALPERRFFGVGCESCHGSGTAHVAAARAGNYTQGKMESLGKLPARELNLRCGKCHGTPEDVAAAHLPGDVTNRMQTYGLMESKCFQKSPETLSCVTCHNPHENAKTQPVFYERICLKCHSTPASNQKTCPINPKTNCVSCHMPLRKALSGSDIPMKMADHKIKIPEK